VTPIVLNCYAAPTYIEDLLCKLAWLNLTDARQTPRIELAQYPWSVALDRFCQAAQSGGLVPLNVELYEIDMLLPPQDIIAYK
jgi:hypothetical protein